MELVQSTLYKNVICLTIQYSESYLLTQESRVRIRDELVNSYQKMLDENSNLETKSCLVEIKSKTAGSRLVRALFELWKKINIYPNSKLICVGYPKDYIESLDTLGLTSLDGFSLTDNKDEALN